MSYTLKDLRTIAAKLTGAAIKSLFPQACLVGGDASDYGFYYDFILEKEFLDAQGVLHLEQRMHDLVFRGVHAKTTDMVRDNAADLFKHQHQPYLSQQLKEYPSGLIQLIKIESFHDICSVEFDSTLNRLGVFKLLQSEEKIVEYAGLKSLKVIRVTGTLFPSQQELKNYLKSARDAKKFMHQVVGQQLNLFRFDELGRCYWSPKGNKLKNLLIDWWGKALEKQGFTPVETPDDHTNSRRISHFNAQHLFAMGDSLGELLLVNAQTPQQQLLGLWRSPYYVKDAARRFCKASEVKNHLISSLQFISEMYNILGSGFYWQIGGDQTLSKKQKAQNKPAVDLLTEAMQSCGLPFTLGEEGTPTATLYLTDCFGKPWAGPYVSLEIEGADNQDSPNTAVVMGLWGSLERFIAWQLEHRHEAHENKYVAEIRSNGIVSEERFVGVDQLLQKL